MKRLGHKHLPLGLLVVMALMVAGCASDGSSGYHQTEVVYGVYGGYGAGYYHNDVIVTPRPPSQPPAVKPSPPPHASTLPARSLPRPAPRRR